MSESDTFQNCWARHNEAVAKANEMNKSVVFDALAAAGITGVTAAFDGAGDSGQIDDAAAFVNDEPAGFPVVTVIMHAARWNSGVPDVVETSLCDAVHDLCYGYLEQTHAGWGNNDGACGEFVFDVAARTVDLEFHGRFTETWITTHTF